LGQGLELRERVALCQMTSALLSRRIETVVGYPPLVGRGADVSEVFHDEDGVFHHAGTEARVVGPAPDHADYGSFASFSDPDDNGWVLQEVKTRLPGQVTGATYESAADLKQALVSAEAEHGKHEEKTGEPDADWPGWYAQYMTAELTGEDLPA
jgi:hypothetical protein